MDTRDVQAPPPLAPAGRDTAPLEPVAQRALLEAAQRGDPDAQKRLVEANLRLVGSIVRRFAHRTAGWGDGTIDTDDLFQAGCIGLLKAIQNFDLERPVRFSTYAVPVIMGEIRRHLRDHQPVKVGRTLRDLALRVEACRDRLAQERGRPPTPGEIASELGLDREEVVAVEGALSRPESLDRAVEGEEGGAPSLHHLLGEGDAGFSSVVENLALRQALARMEGWERRLVAMRFFEQRPQSDVARALGVSQAYVSRAERRILARLRRSLA